MNPKLRKAGVFTLMVLGVFVVGTSQVTCQGAEARPSLAVLDAMMTMVKDAVCEHYLLTGNPPPAFCPEPTACEQPTESGPCRAYLPRWTFDEAAGECVRFIYGGCGGNENNFPTLAACQGTCIPCDAECERYEECQILDGEAVCVETCDRVRCPEGEVCEEIQPLCVTGPCPPIAQCVPETPEPSACEQPIEVGPCQALIPRYAFDADSGVCERFNYGGCGGNDNNFQTLGECVSECGGDVCELPEEPGPCRAYIPRWAHDPETGQCEQFIYGGCGGNPNNFTTQAACEQECVDPLDPCDQPTVVGPCLARIPRFTYDADSGQCERFFYGGCGGNGNNFTTLGACERACEEPVGQCEQPIDSGPCRASFARWAWDPQAQDCTRFIWGGCGGNENNFETQDECRRACR